MKPKRVKEPSEESSSDEDEPTVDMVSSDDAWMFPIGGSVMLVGLYVLFKYLNKDYLNYLFTAYFGVIGVFAVSNVLPFISGSELIRLVLRDIKELQDVWERRFIDIMSLLNNVGKVIILFVFC